MKSRLIALLLLLIAVAPAAEAARLKVVQVVAATTTNTTVDFSSIGGVEEVIIANDGAASVYINLTGPTATTSDFEIKNGEILNHHQATLKIGIITVSGTATVRVQGSRP